MTNGFGFRFKFYCIKCFHYSSFSPCIHEQEDLDHICKHFKEWLKNDNT